MKRPSSAFLLLASAVISAIMVLTAVVAVRRIGASAYASYRAGGGEKGFWSWFAKDACALPIPSVASAEEERARAVKKAAEKEKTERAARLRAAARREAELQAKAERLAKKLAKGRDGAGNASADGKAGGKRRRTDAKSGHRGGAVKTGGASSYRANDGKTPYRVTGIRGIEFGTSDNAPGAGVKPVLSVSVDEDGNMSFNRLRWRENKSLTEPVYGFDRAYLNHSYETEQLSSVTFHKEFPFSEEGLRQATEFYKSMSAEASRDLGFEVIDVDRTGNLKSATVCEFKNGDGETSIRGAINAWNDKTLTVTFSVSDKACSDETRRQSEAAFQSGEADRVDARIEVVNRDHTAAKERIGSYLQDW